MKIKILLIIAFLFLSCPALAKDYYISAAGDGDTCSSETPCALSYAITQAGNEDTIFFKSDDTWSASSNYVLSAVAGVTYDGSTYGTGTRATLQATGNLSSVVLLYASSVTLKGFNINGNNNIASGILIGDSYDGDLSNITVENCIVHDLDGENQAYYGIHIGGISYPNHTVSSVTIKDTTVYNIAYEGIAVYTSWGQAGIQVDGVTIQNCTVHDTGKVNYGVGIAILNNSDNVTVEFSTVYDNPSTGIQFGTSSTQDSGSPNGGIIRYNVIYGNNYGIGTNFTQTGVTFAASGVFHNNIIYNNTLSEITVANSSSGGNFGTTSLSYYNNTIYKTSGTGGIDTIAIAKFAALGGTPTINFNNNIVYTNTFNIISDIRTLLTHSNNLFFRSSAATDSHAVIGETTYDRDGTASDLTNWEATAQKTDPAFSGGTLPTGFTGTYGTNMVPNTDYFQLTVDSPAKDAGATLASYTGAINGAGLTTPIVRPLGAAYDIGAYEYGTVAQSGGSAGSGLKMQGVTIR